MTMPGKLAVLESLGITVTGRKSCIVQAGEHNAGYLDTKRARMDHLLGSRDGSMDAGDEGGELDGSFCFWNHDGEPSQPTSTVHSAGGLGLPNRLNKLKQSHRVQATGRKASS